MYQGCYCDQLPGDFSYTDSSSGENIYEVPLKNNPPTTLPARAVSSTLRPQNTTLRPQNTKLPP